VVHRQNEDIVDNLHLREVAMAITFWLLMCYNFSCMIASDTLAKHCLILGVGFQGQWRHSPFRGSKRRCHGNHVGFL